MKLLDTIEICDDCLVATANNDYSGMDHDTKRRVHFMINDLWVNGRAFVVPTEENLGFCTSPCGLCGFPKHGNRTEANLFSR